MTEFFRSLELNRFRETDFHSENAHVPIWSLQVPIISLGGDFSPMFLWSENFSLKSLGVAVKIAPQASSKHDFKTSSAQLTRCNKELRVRNYFHRNTCRRVKIKEGVFDKFWVTSSIFLREKGIFFLIQRGRIYQSDPRYEKS